MKTRIIGIFLLGTLAYACASKSTVATAPKEEEKPKVVVLSAALTEGQNLYENNCAKCHKLYDAKDFTKEEWKPIVLRMQRKARLDDAQTASIYNYITSGL